MSYKTIHPPHMCHEGQNLLCSIKPLFVPGCKHILSAVKFDIWSQPLAACCIGFTRETWRLLVGEDKKFIHADFVKGWSWLHTFAFTNRKLLGLKVNSCVNGASYYLPLGNTMEKSRPKDLKTWFYNLIYLKHLNKMLQDIKKKTRKDMTQWPETFSWKVMNKRLRMF